MGIPIWEIDINLAFKDILRCESDTAKTMLLEFHYNCVSKADNRHSVNYPHLAIALSHNNRIPIDDDEKEEQKRHELDVYDHEDYNEYERDIQINNRYSNALDFLIVVTDDGYSTHKYDKLKIFELYINKHGERSIRNN